jgi:5-methylcytosine-specific restriction endonuclease McrA
MTRIRALDGDLCFYCGGLMRFPWEVPNNCQRASIEHLIDVSRGGTRMIENVVNAHERCNSGRGQLKTLADKIASRLPGAPPIPHRVWVLWRNETAMLEEMRSHREDRGIVPASGYLHP